MIASAVFYTWGTEIPMVELRCRLRLTCMQAKLFQRKLRLFGHVARRHEGEPIRSLLLPTSPRTRRKRAKGQLKTWSTTLKEDLQPPSGPRKRKDWAKVSCELAQDRRVWVASTWDVANSIANNSWSRPGRTPRRVQSPLVNQTCSQKTNSPSLI